MHWRYVAKSTRRSKELAVRFVWGNYPSLYGVNTYYKTVKYEDFQHLHFYPDDERNNPFQPIWALLKICKNSWCKIASINNSRNPDCTFQETTPMRWQTNFPEDPLVATFLAWIHLNFQPQPISLNLRKIKSVFITFLPGGFEVGSYLLYFVRHRSKSVIRHYIVSQIILSCDRMATKHWLWK